MLSLYHKSDVKGHANALIKLMTEDTYVDRYYERVCILLCLNDEIKI